MASSRNAEREEERRFNLRTLAIASSASATAAVVTSQLWIAGTWIAAAMTPLIVALVSELLHRPTERIAGRLTSDRPALRAERREQAEVARPAPAETARVATGKGEQEEEPGAHGPIRVYRSSPPPGRRRKVAVGAVLGTGALALLIAVVVLTVPELVAGGAIGGKDRSTTLFSVRDRNSSSDQKQDQDSEQQQPGGAKTDRSDEEQPTSTSPTEETETEVPPEETETETTPTTPPPAEAPTDTAPPPAPTPTQP
jgi:hypothetical protein